MAGNVGGIPDAVIDGVTGRLVPEKDSAALADAICELIADPEKRQRMGRNGFYFVQKAFSWNRIVTNLESLYRQAAKTSQTTLPTQATKKTNGIGKGFTQAA